MGPAGWQGAGLGCLERARVSGFVLGSGGLALSKVVGARLRHRPDPAGLESALERCGGRPGRRRCRLLAGRRCLGSCLEGPKGLLVGSRVPRPGVERGMRLGGNPGKTTGLGAVAEFGARFV